MAPTAFFCFTLYFSFSDYIASLFLLISPFDVVGPKKIFALSSGNRKMLWWNFSNTYYYFCFFLNRELKVCTFFLRKKINLSLKFEVILFFFPFLLFFKLSGSLDSQYYYITEESGLVDDLFNLAFLLAPLSSSNPPSALPFHFFFDV